MPLNSVEIMNALSTLSEEKNLRVTVKESVKAGCIVGACTTVGALVSGPPGILIGGVIGACSAAYMSKGKFKPVAHVILYDMTDRQRDKLTVSVQKVIEDFRVEDLTILLPMLLSNQSLQAAVLKELVNFLTNEMHLQIID